MKSLRIFLAVLLTSWLAAPMAGLAAPPKPVVKIENPGQCIAPAEEMRVNHMVMLSHSRDRTLRQGVRTEKANLNGCVECHASKTTGSVLGKDGFCESCHTYTAVSVDCWQCHQPKANFKAAGAKP